MSGYEEFRRLMYEHNIRIADVVRGTGVTRMTILNWKKGGNTSLRTLRRIANYFEVPVETFMKEKE